MRKLESLEERKIYSRSKKKSLNKKEIKIQIADDKSQQQKNKKKRSRGRRQKDHHQDDNSEAVEKLESLKLYGISKLPKSMISKQKQEMKKKCRKILDPLPRAKEKLEIYEDSSSSDDANSVEMKINKKKKRSSGGKRRVRSANLKSLKKNNN